MVFGVSILKHFRIITLSCSMSIFNSAHFSQKKSVNSVDPGEMAHNESPHLDHLSLLSMTKHG